MHIRIVEKVELVSGNLADPVFVYIGESGSGKDRRIKLEGATTFDKMLNLYKAGTYVSIGPAEGSREWNKLDKEDQSDYRILQARAKKRTTYKQMGEFLADICAANECFLFAIRQGNDAVWVNPKALKELLDTEWHGMDKYWIEDACGVWAHHDAEYAKWKKRFGQEGKNESDEWDDDQYKEWALDDIGPLIDRCWASIESAIKEKYPGATLTPNNDTEVEDVSAQRGRDWRNTTVSLKETGKLTVPVEYDPLEDSPEVDSAVGRDIDSITSILGGIKFNTRRASIRQKGNLRDPEILSDEPDFEGKAIVIPLTFTYAYHYEDSAY